MRSVLLLLLIPLSGCLDADGLSDLLDQPADPIQVTEFLWSDGATNNAAPEPSMQALDWSLGDWSQGRMAPAWQSAPAATAYNILAANVTISYEAARPLLDSQQRPPFTVWFGVGDSIIYHGFADGPDLWMPGDRQDITFNVESLPLGGLVVAEGQSVVLHVGSYYPDGGGQENVLVHFGEGGSRMDLTTQQVRLAPLKEGTEALNESADLAGGRCIAPINPEESAQVVYTFDVPESTRAVTIEVTRAFGVGFGPDIDFGVSDAAGDRVAHAAGSSAPEVIRLYQPNLDVTTPGQWTLMVYNCQPQVSQVDVTVLLQ